MKYQIKNNNNIKHNMLTKCVICGKPASFKIINEDIYYCNECYLKFFSQDCLIEISKLKKATSDSYIIKKIIDNKIKDNSNN